MRRRNPYEGKTFGRQGIGLTDPWDPNVEAFKRNTGITFPIGADPGRAVDTSTHPVTLILDKRTAITRVIAVGEVSYEELIKGHFRRSTHKLSAPVQFFSKLLDIWELGLDSAYLLLGYEKSGKSHVQAILSGAVLLETRDEKDRIAELFVIRKILHSIFRDTKVENQWLR
ncbi:MAG: hypothetical protein L0Z68_10780, partial [Gammaproteobacteria bacterium]|nr:hypothetical protein [Gammaproteobacteria bacterium]